MNTHDLKNKLSVTYQQLTSLIKDAHSAKVKAHLMNAQNDVKAAPMRNPMRDGLGPPLPENPTKAEWYAHLEWWRNRARQEKRCLIVPTPVQRARMGHHERR